MDDALKTRGIILRLVSCLSSLIKISGYAPVRSQ